jgi:tetratricopeptide (TPR) repeat protein
MRGHVALARNQLDEAIPAFQEVIKEVPKYERAQYYLGVAYQRRQNTQLAKTAFTAAIDITPTFAGSYLALMDLHRQFKEFTDALEVGQKFLKSQPNSASPYLALGQVYLDQGEISQALVAFKTAREKAPQEPNGYYYLGLAYRRQGKNQEALVAFEKALSFDASFIDALTEVTAIFMANGQKDKALARTRRQIQASPNNPSLYNLLGNIALAQDKDTEAEEAFKKAIELRDDLLISYLNLGRLYAKKQSYDQATTYYESIIATKPHIFPPYMTLGILYSLHEKYEKANEYYKKVIQINPGYTQAINELAWNYAEHGGNLDEALSLAHKAREQAVDRTQITDTLGWIYYKKKVYAQAVSLLKESAAAMANNPVARYHLGMAYYKNGNKDLARAELQQALKLDSDFRGSREAREVLAVLE